MATKQEEATEQAYFAEQIKQEKKEEQTMANEPGKPANQQERSTATTSTADVDPIQVAVNNNPNFRDSLILLLEEVAKQIVAEKDDPNTVQKVAERLKARAGSYADAVTNNTGYAPVVAANAEKEKKSSHV